MAILMGFLIAALAATAAAEKATITELGGKKTKGVIEVNAPAASLYKVMTDYADWRRVLTDIRKVEVKSEGREDAVVWFDSKALKDRATIQFDNQPNKVIKFRLVDGPKGARAWGEYVLTAIDDGKRTRITATLYLDVVGATGLFIRDKTVRRNRQNKVRADLEDLARYFE